jgi:Ca2+/Na+ antiporter
MNILVIIIVIAVAAYVYRTFFYSKPYETKDERYNAERHKRQMELDNLLDKIANKGIDSLSQQERRRLDELSGKR